jgi:hypothetical protein
VVAKKAVATLKVADADTAELADADTAELADADTAELADADADTAAINKISYPKLLELTKLE